MLSSISNLFSAINYEYDDGGQVKSEQNNIAGANGTGQVNYYRYPSGEVAHLQYPNGTIVRKEYTARGQLELVQDGSAQQPVHYRYLRDGKVDYQDYANGTRTVFGYDARGLIGSVWHKNGTGRTLSYRDYWRDDRDRITAWRKSLDASVNRMENGRGDRYGYDEAGQLTLASYQTSNPNGNAPDPERMDVFNYDALGNRMQDDHLASRGWMNFTRDDNGLNQYTGWWPYNFTKYDDDIGNGWGAPHAANGVLMQDGWITAGYNALNQPKMISSQAYNGTSNWMWFGFDPLGRCVKRWVSSSGDPNTTTATFFYYDGWNLLQEGAGGANAQRLYIHGARVDEIVKSFNFTTGQSAYHHYDARGHCTMLTDPNGDIMEQYDYDAFGFPRFYDATGNSLTVHDVPSNTERGYSPYGNRFLFTGREWLTDLKLYDYRNRLYQPELGRFLQPDPKQFEAGDYNIYRYCENDPVNKSDPTGLGYDEEMLNLPEGSGSMGRAIAAATRAVVQHVSDNREIYIGAAMAAIESYRTHGFTSGMGPRMRMAPSLSNLNRQLSAKEIAGGHAFGKHAAEFGFKSREQMAAHVEKVMANPTMTRSLERGRTAYFDRASGTVVIRDPNHKDGGTVFIPTKEKPETYFKERLK